MSTDELKSTIAATWDAGAAAYDATPRHGLRHDDEWVAWRRLVAAILGDATHADVPRLRVLDVGVGTGVLALLAAELGHDVTGVDMSPGMLEQARRKALAMGLAIALLAADAEDLPPALSGFDAIVCRHLLWTLPDPERALRGWCTAARAGGLIAIIDGYGRRARPPRSWAVSAAALLVARRSGHDGRDHDYPESAYRSLPLARQADGGAVRALLQATGLADVHVRRLTEVDRVERAHLDPLARLADRWTPYLATGRVPPSS